MGHRNNGHWEWSGWGHTIGKLHASWPEYSPIGHWVGWLALGSGWPKSPHTILGLINSSSLFTTLVLLAPTGESPMGMAGSSLALGNNVGQWSIGSIQYKVVMVVGGWALGPSRVHWPPVRGWVSQWLMCGEYPGITMGKCGVNSQSGSKVPMGPVMGPGMGSMVNQYCGEWE